MSPTSKYSVLKNSLHSSLVSLITFAEDDNISGITYLPYLNHHDNVGCTELSKGATRSQSPKKKVFIKSSMCLYTFV